MLIASLFLLFVFQQRYGAQCTSATVARPLSNNKLVDLIKQHLKINNDDYIEKLNSSQRPPSAQAQATVLNKRSGSDNVAKTNVKQENTEKQTIIKKNVDIDAKRRYLNLDFSSDEQNYNKYSFSPITNNPSVAVPTINPKRFQKALSTTKHDSTTSALKPIAASDLYKDKAVDKLKKLKQFMDKNQDLFQEFLNNKKKEEARMEPMPTLRADAERQGMMRARSREVFSKAVLGPNQLDMAPAKGSRIHHLRAHDRLCHRSVLIPEGPKYDSKGIIYLKPYKPVGAKDYPQTKEPKLILPRCCNCCKKSVLGCE